MSRIKSRDTTVELRLRKYIWNRGYRNYRIKSKVLGKPDIYFPKIRLAVFIDGCFWHRCPKCFIGPKSNKKYWGPKIARNVERDKDINKQLRKQGVTVVRFWEHEIKKDVHKCYNKFKQIYEKQAKNN